MWGTFYLFNKKGKNMTRPISTIAKDISADWNKVYFGAVPYLDAMHSLNSINDDYYYDSGKSVVRYFLANASTWRGDKAREIKAELKAML
jgi:hypothetical protein